MGWARLESLFYNNIIEERDYIIVYIIEEVKGLEEVSEKTSVLSHIGI